MKRACTLALSLLALHGCASSDATQLVVLMDTDYLVPDEVDRLRARISKTVDTGDGTDEVETWNRTFPVDSDGVDQDAFALPATFAVVPAEGDIDSEVIVELTALEAGTDAVLVHRRVRTGFVRGRAVVLRMLLYRACEGLECGAGQSCGCADASACGQPECVDESVSPTMLEPIDDPAALPPDSDFPVTSNPSTGGAGGDAGSGGVGGDGGSDASGGTGGSDTIDCDVPLEVCLDQCVNTRIDPRFCGDCEIACPTGYVCQDGGCLDPGDCSTNGVGCEGFTYCDEDSGRCLRGCSVDEQCPRDHEVCDLESRECVCSDGFDRCGFECVETDIDPRFCGSCDVSCAPGFVCDLGRCVDPGDCRTNGEGCAGFTYCDSASGRCLFGCDTNEQCSGEAQVCDVPAHECVCDSGFHECGVGCVSDFEVDHCGNSCVPCPAPEGSTPTCDGVACDFVCDAGLQRCGSECVDTATDADFCGDCQTSCDIGEECQIGECFDPGDCRTNGVGCADFTFCDGASGDCLPGCDRDAQCTELNEVCNLSLNVCDCAPGYHDCGGVCVSDLDVASCGALCSPCPAPPGSTATCEAGACEFVCGEDYERCGDACCLVRCPAGQVLFEGQCAPFHVRTADPQGNVGKYASVALSAGGLPRVAYYADSGKNALFSSLASNGNWTRETVLAASDVGKHISLARRPNGSWAVAFYEEDDQSLIVAGREGAATWSVETVDESAGVGEYTSIAFDAAGFAHVAYYDRDEKDLLYAVQQPGGGWDLQTIASGGSVGKYASLAFDPDGRAHVAYYDESDKDLEVAIESAGGGWTIEVVASAGDVGKHAALAFDPDGLPHVSYWDEGNKDLAVATRVGGATWTFETIDAQGDVGRYTSLAFGSDGTAHVSYEDQSNRDLKYASKPLGGVWSPQTIDAAGDVGEYTSIAVDADGNAHVAYYDKSNTNLKYAIIAGAQ